MAGPSPWTIEQRDLRKLAKAGLADFGPALRKNLRREITLIARAAAADARAAARNMPVKGSQPMHPGARSLRTDIAAAIRPNVAVSSGKLVRASVTMVNTSALQENSRYRAARLLDRNETFRHPRYGNLNINWANQQGHPYFKSTIRQRAINDRVQIRVALLAACAETMPNFVP